MGAQMNAYFTGHKHCERVLTAFCRGSGFGHVRVSEGLQPGPAAFYGILRGAGVLMKQAQADGRDWYFVDNGYFGAHHYDGYYRVTRNAYQSRGDAAPDYVRLGALGLELQPWRTSGDHILVCPPGEEYCQHHGLGRWLAQILVELDQATDRRVVVRTKDSPDPLEKDLEGAHALVTHASNAAVRALVAGVPVFCTGECAASSLAIPDLASVDRVQPHEGDRERWAAVLANSQWTLEEMRSGAAWSSLNNIG